VHEGAALNDGVEPVDGVSSIQHCAHCAVGLHQAVAALDDVSAAALVLALSVAGQYVSNVVREGVLRMWVIVSANRRRDDTTLGSS
jgi:hypothetical protein